jgi:hypothetical protein
LPAVAPAAVASPSAAPLAQFANGGEVVSKRRRKQRCLYDIASARSGDKGSNANVGVVSRAAEGWEFLRTWLTSDRVAAFLAPLEIESVERFELPNLGALNFVLRGVLRRGLRTDAQGKAIGQILFEMPLPEDARV